MKVFLLCLVFVIGGLNANTVQLSGPQKDRALQYTAECVKESGVKPEIIAVAKKGQYSDDEGLKKFTHCFFRKSGIITPDSKLNVDVAIAKLPPGIDKTEATKLLEQCKNKTGKDAVDTAYEIFKCYNSGISTHVAY